MVVHKPKLSLAAMLDIKQLVRLEGSCFELLEVYSRDEGLRALGRSLQNGEGVLPNFDAIIRSTMKLRNGVVISTVTSMGFVKRK